MATIVPGDTVRTPLGKGVVQEVRHRDRLLVLIGNRSVVVDAGDVHVSDPPPAPSDGAAPPPIRLRPQTIDTGATPPPPSICTA